MNILIKKQNGNIAYTRLNKTVSLSPYSTLEVVSADEIKVRQGQGQTESIFLSDLEIQIDPAPAAAFTGDIDTLFNTLIDNIFLIA